MSGSRARAKARARAVARRREDRWGIIALLTAVVLVIIGLVKGGDEQQARPWSMPSGSLNSETLASEPEPGPERKDLPSSGPGTFSYDNETGSVLGVDGPVKRFHLAVESNLDSDLGEFSELADATLGDERSWVFEKKQRFQRVPENQKSEFKIVLATRDTAYKLCARAGLDIREDGIPYTSCQANSWVVINLDRWRLSTPDYRTTNTPIVAYREYVLNHEVGHQLGRPHEPCPGGGRLAPVMQQQTLGLQGCLPNAWPYPNAVT